LLAEAVGSVRAQLYPHWELCIADDASPDPAVWRALQGYAAEDPRIHIVRRTKNGGISAASNDALGLATGPFVALLDHDDLLTEDALYHVAAAIERRPDAALLYSDEDKIDEHGQRSRPHFKGAWNAELMLGQNAVNHLGVYRTALVREAGGFDSRFDGAQDHDLALRVSEHVGPTRIVHIPRTLYHWRWRGRQGSYSRRQLAKCADAARRAVDEHLERSGEPGATVEVQKGGGSWLRVRRPLPSPAPLVSILVPTRDRAELVAQVAQGVLEQTDYTPFELLIIDNGSEKPETLALFARLAADPRVRIVPAPMPFNYSALINLGVREAKGEIILQLNNDISVIHPDWLSELVSHAVRPEVGAVGAKLLYPTGDVQHAGVVLGVGGDEQRVAGHAHHHALGTSTGYQGSLTLVRNVSAVTAACMAMRKAVYEEVGGMDEADLAVAFNDVDLCLKIRDAGYDIVWTPFATLYHHESASRGSDLAPEVVSRFQREIDVMLKRWAPELAEDPFYSPAFDTHVPNFSLAERPRRAKPWLT
jgi:GT2 family glycosyltransferase